MANEKVHSQIESFIAHELRDPFGIVRTGVMRVVLESDHAARERELLDALREYRRGGCRCGSLSTYGCDLCKRADELLKEGE